MKINITAGEELNKILTSKYNDSFVPFNEAMNEGPRVYPLFSEEFIKKRCIHHNVDISLYKEKLFLFLEFLNDMNKYDEVILWFGDDDFCIKNVEVILEVLKDFKGSIIRNTLDEYTGEILKSEVVK